MQRIYTSQNKAKRKNREGVKGMEPTKGFDTIVLTVVENEDKGEEEDWGE